MSLKQNLKKRKDRGLSYKNYLKKHKLLKYEF